MRVGWAIIFAFLFPLAAVAAEPAEAPVESRGESAGKAGEEAGGGQDNEIRRIARAGAHDLALRLLDRRQSELDRDSEAWLALERERVELQRARGRWDRVAERLAAFPESAPPAARQWARTMRARALLETDRPREARRLLRDLIWEAPAGSDGLALLRRLVVESYLIEGRPEDAEAAVRRYRQDHGDSPAGWPALQARLYLRTGRPGPALDILRSAESPPPWLVWLAELEARRREPAAVMQAAIQYGVNKANDSADRRRAWAVASRAAWAAGNPVAHIAALERSLALTEPGEGKEGLFSVTPDRLWRAYLEFGESLGNALELVVGDDQAWFVEASNRYDSDPMRARALFAVVALKAWQPAHRREAHRQFAALLGEGPGGGAILEHLYLHSDRFEAVGQIPDAVRYQLVDQVLSRPDIPLASRLMTGLDEPPPEIAPSDWHLRRARVLLLGGHPEEGIESLDALIQLDDIGEVDRVLQVVFDLQTIERHHAALRFFEAVLNREATPEKQKREILFWMGDSWKGLDRPVEAARHYLLSAGYDDPFAMDQWAQTARFRAAEQLAEAGLAADARRIYQKLLNATREPARQSVLRNRIQRLTLGEANRAPGKTNDAH